MEQIAIPKTAALTYGLPAILRAFENAKQPTIFATHFMQNVKLERYWPAATVGECTPIAYDRPETAMAFFEMLEHTATSGRNFDYAAQLLVNNAPCKILMMFTRMSAHAPTNENIFVRQIPESMPFNELIREIGTAIQETGARLVIVDDLAGYAKDNCRNVWVALDVIAQMRDVLLLAGFLLNEDSEEPSRYLAAHAHNLCQLTTHSVRMVNSDGSFREQPYFCFSYGGVANPLREFFGLSDGKITPVFDLKKLLRVKQLASIHAREWISQRRFLDICVGATGNEFLQNSIYGAIQSAVKNGFILRSGNSRQTKIIYSESSHLNTSKNDDLAITALTNLYSSSKHSRQRKPLLRFGEFKLLAPEQQNTNPYIAQYFLIELIGHVVTGRKMLDFNIVAKHRNTLAFIISSNRNAADRLKNRIQSFGDGATFNCVGLPPTSDEEFFSFFKQAIENEKPDFVFVFCVDRLKPTLSRAQLIEQLVKFSKSKNICTIAQSDTPIDRTKYNFGNEIFWGISALVRNCDLDDCFETHHILLPRFFSFKASAGDFDFLCRFDANIGKTRKEELLNAYLIATFYCCNNTPATDINDCTGSPLTRNVINQALHRGLIEIEYLNSKKNPLESRITFVGGRKKK